MDETLVLYVRNPYSKIPKALLVSICRECGVSTDYGPDELWRLDEVCADPWFDQVKRAMKNGRYGKLSVAALTCFAARIGVPLQDLPRSLHSHQVLLLLISRTQGRVTPNIDHVSNETLDELLVHIGYGSERNFLAILTRDEKKARFFSAHVPYTETQKKRAARYQNIQEQPRRDLIRKLYGPGNEYLDSTPNWAEIAIRNPKSITYEWCAQHQIRVHSDHGPIEWFCNNILDYLPIWSRKPGEVAERQAQNSPHVPYYHLMTDYEIAQEVRLSLLYKSRAQLVKKLENMRRVPDFFLPHSSWPLERAMNRNLETFWGADLRECKGLLIGFGSCLKAYLYDVEDLLGSFYLSGTFSFRCPHAPQREIFSKRQMKSLTKLLNERKSDEGVPELLGRIREGRRLLEAQKGKDQHLLNIFKSLLPEDQGSVHWVLHHIIDTGFYMRHWKGPDHPLPLKESDTNTKMDPDPKTKKSFEETSVRIRSMPTVVRSLLWNLPTLRYNKGISQPRTGSLKTWWLGVGNGSICIRAASAVLIGTSVHFLHLFFRELPSFPLAELDLIV